MEPMTITIAPKITAEVVLRFADGAETVIGKLTYSADMDVKLTAPGIMQYTLKWSDRND